MNIIVPHADNPKNPTWPLLAVQLALIQDGHQPDLRKMDSDESYFYLLRDLWSRNETFTIVEHDIIPWPNAIQELEDCPEPWCAFPYYCSLGWIVDGLGCTKFEGSFTKSLPDFFHEPFPVCCNHSTHYCGLDRLIAHKMRELDLKVHQHQPGVSNLNPRWTV